MLWQPRSRDEVALADDRREAGIARALWLFLAAYAAVWLLVVLL